MRPVIQLTAGLRRSFRLSGQCSMGGCEQPTKYIDTNFCVFHTQELTRLGLLNSDTHEVKIHNEDTTTIISDHLKVSIEQTAKGARVSVTYDRSDHDIDTAVKDAIKAYKKTVLGMNREHLFLEPAMELDDIREARRREEAGFE